MARRTINWPQKVTHMKDPDKAWEDCSPETLLLLRRRSTCWKLLFYFDYRFLKLGLQRKKAQKKLEKKFWHSFTETGRVVNCHWWWAFVAGLRMFLFCYYCRKKSVIISSSQINPSQIMELFVREIEGKSYFINHISSICKSSSN